MADQEPSGDRPSFSTFWKRSKEALTGKQITFVPPNTGSSKSVSAAHLSASLQVPSPWPPAAFHSFSPCPLVPSGSFPAARLRQPTIHDLSRRTLDSRPSGDRRQQPSLARWPAMVRIGLSFGNLGLSVAFILLFPGDLTGGDRHVSVDEGGSISSRPGGAPPPSQASTQVQRSHCHPHQVEEQQTCVSITSSWLSYPIRVRVLQSLESKPEHAPMPPAPLSISPPPPFRRRCCGF